MDEFLAERAKVSRDWEEDTFGETLSLCKNDLYHSTKNPSGYINIRTAINNLCKEIVLPKLNDIWMTTGFDSLQYNNCEIDSIKLRQSMAKFMTYFFESYEPVSPENLFCSTGVRSCLDLLCHCLADPGQVLLVPTPMYGRTYKNCMMRSLVELFPIPVIAEDDEYEHEHPCLTIKKIVSAYEIAKKADYTVRGILLINPNIPLGEIYTPELLMEIMCFCKEKSLHLIVDEIFALSVFATPNSFHSILKFPQLPDTDRTHVIYGLSKDFGIPGLRIGVIHTKCKQLQKSLKNILCFQKIPYPVMKIAAEFLGDFDFCIAYVFEHQTRLATNYKYCFEFLREIGVKVRKCEAGFYLWLDLRHLCGSSFEGEQKLSSYLQSYTKLLIGRGEEFFCAQPGWFRITFARSINYLTEGLDRLHVALTSYKL